MPSASTNGRRSGDEGERGTDMTTASDRWGWGDPENLRRGMTTGDAQRVRALGSFPAGMGWPWRGWRDAARASKARKCK